MKDPVIHHIFKGAGNGKDYITDCGRTTEGSGIIERTIHYWSHVTCKQCLIKKPNKKP